MKLINESKNEFTDISSEAWRQYITPVGTLKIVEPISLSVSANGHRVLDAEGVSYYIDTRFGFILKWKAKDGQPHFVK